MKMYVNAERNVILNDGACQDGWMCKGVNFYAQVNI